MKALLSFRITVDNEDKDTPVFSNVKLYKESEELIWRIDGELGDECESLPRPSSISQAKDDVRLVYPSNSQFNPCAPWL